VFDGQDISKPSAHRRTGYDVAVVASDKLGRLIAAASCRSSTTACCRRAGTRRELHAALARIDPGNAHASATTGHDRHRLDLSKLKELAPDAPNDSWQLIYDPRIVARMAGCGVSVVDAPSESSRRR